MHAHFLTSVHAENHLALPPLLPLAVFCTLTRLYFARKKENANDLFPRRYRVIAAFRNVINLTNSHGDVTSSCRLGWARVKVHQGQGTLGRGRARLGEARRGEARAGEARPGEARPGGG